MIGKAQSDPSRIQRLSPVRSIQSVYSNIAVAETRGILACRLQDHRYTEELMHTSRLRTAFVIVSALFVMSSGILPQPHGEKVYAQTHGQKEEFTAVAIANNNIQTGAGTVLISIDRWSTNAERETFVATLRNKGPQALVDALQDTRPVGRIRTPDSIG